MRGAPAGSGRALPAQRRRQARQAQQRQVRDERLALQAQRQRHALRCVPVNDVEPLPRID